MRRLAAIVGLTACTVVAGPACSGSDEEPGRLPTIDGPAQVDDDVRGEPSGGDDSPEG